MTAFINRLVSLVLTQASLIFLWSDISFKKNFLFIENTILKNRKSILKEHYFLVNAIITIEDKRFYSHKGIDIYSMVRAVCKNIFTKRLEGASTLTQQLVRIITDERQVTLRRKFRELLMAALIETKFSKNDLISNYMSLYKFSKLQGLEELCINEKYDYNALTSHNCMAIAARFKYPKLNSVNYIKYLKRVRTIEKKMSPQVITHSFNLPIKSNPKTNPCSNDSFLLVKSPHHLFQTIL